MTTSSPLGPGWSGVIVHQPEGEIAIVHDSTGTIDLSLEFGTKAPICGRRNVPFYVICIAMPGHDGPHMPCSVALLEKEKPAITAMRKLRPPCRCSWVNVSDVFWMETTNPPRQLRSL